MTPTLNFDDREYTACKQGLTFHALLHITHKKTRLPVDYSTASFKMQIKDNYDTPVIVELSTANNRIYVDSNYDINLFISASDTALLPHGTYLYDIIVENSGNKDTLLAGVFLIKRTVTQND